MNLRLKINLFSLTIPAIITLIIIISGLFVMNRVIREQDKAILGYYQKLAKTNPGNERYKLEGLNDDDIYSISSRTQYMDIRQFGDLINMVLPVDVNTEGFLHSKIADNYLYELEKTNFKAYGDQLINHGFAPKQQFYGTGLDDHIAFIGDFGSRLFFFEKERK